jgi:hypothetical protein
MLHNIHLHDLKTAMLLTLLPFWPAISWLYANGFLPEYTSVLGVLAAITLDTVLGLMASRKAKGKVSSYRLRKMFGKVAQYLVVIVLFLLISKSIPNETVRTWVMAFPYTAISLFEGISIVENMLIIWPQSRLLRGISGLLNLKVRDLLDDGQLNGSAGTINDKHDA